MLKKRRLQLFFLFISLTICSCYKSKRPGFTETKTGLFYKIKSIGDGNRKVQQGDLLLAHVTYRTESDSLLSDSATIINIHSPSFIGSFEEAYELMGEGDRFIFIQSPDSLFQKFFKAEKPAHLEKIKYVMMEIKPEKIISEDQVEAERKKMKEDMDIEEQRKLKQYINENRITVLSINTGIYYLPIKNTTGTKVETEKSIAISYKGYFLDGGKFDETKNLEFTMGDQFQVIKGLEYGVSLMREGEKAKFIIPSHLAYGEKGSSTGIVPPYTTVIYEVEVLTVK